MTLELKPEIAAALQTLASSRGLSVERYLEELVASEIGLDGQTEGDSEGTGLVYENGLLVYRTGRPLPTSVIDETIRRLREERAIHILGRRS